MPILIYFKDSHLDSSDDSLDEEDHHYLDTSSFKVLKISVQATSETTRVPFKEEPSLAKKNENKFSPGLRDHMGFKESKQDQHLQGKCPNVSTMSVIKSTTLAIATFILIFLFFTVLFLVFHILL